MAVDRVFFISHSNANNVDSDPGVSFFALRALKSVFNQVTYCGPLKKTRSFGQVLYRLLGSRFKVFPKVLAFHHEQNSRGYARQLGPILRQHPSGVVFALSTVPIANLNTDLPIFLYTDATLKNVENYYPDFTGISPKSMKAGHALERRALAKCRHIFYTSEWARQSAINDYGVNAERTSVLTRGANFVGANNEDETRRFVAARAKDKICLLLIGIDYKRKGVDIAVGAVSELQRRGVDAQLTVVGCNLPPEVEALPYVHNVGFLSKQKPEEEHRLRELFQMSHFFILPTRAECNAIVVLEACSFGLPILATDTGGVGTCVIEGVTGRTMPFEAGGIEYADAIQDLIADRGAYESLCLSAFRKYSAELNWDYVARTIRDTIQRTIEGEAPPS